MEKQGKTEIFIWSKFWFRLKKTLRRAYLGNDSEHFEKYFVRRFFILWTLVADRYILETQS